MFDLMKLFVRNFHVLQDSRKRLEGHEETRRKWRVLTGFKKFDLDETSLGLSEPPEAFSNFLRNLHVLQDLKDMKRLERHEET